MGVPQTSADILIHCKTVYSWRVVAVVATAVAERQAEEEVTLPAFPVVSVPPASTAMVPTCTPVRAVERRTMVEVLEISITVLW